MAALILVLGVSGTAKAEPSEEVRAYFRNGVELLTETPPNYQDAYYQFKLAYEKSDGNWKVLGNLGLCAFKLERDAEAIRYYSDYLEQGADTLSEEEQKQIKRDLLLMQGNMAQVELTSDVADLELLVSRVGSTAPVQAHKLVDGKVTLSLRAGTQKFVANENGKQQIWEIPLSPGETKKHTFTFAEKETPAVGAKNTDAEETKKPAEVEAAPRRNGMGPLRIAGIATAGVGVGALVAGTIFGLSAKKSEGVARDQAEDPDVCRPNSAGDNVCATDAESAFDKARNQALLSNILFIGGGVLTAAGVTMIVLGGSSSPENPSARLELAPQVNPFGGGIAAFGHF
jgi:hypothetical protein